MRFLLLSILAIGLVSCGPNQKTEEEPEKYEGPDNPRSKTSLHIIGGSPWCYTVRKGASSTQVVFSFDNFDGEMRARSYKISRTGRKTLEGKCENGRWGLRGNILNIDACGTKMEVEYIDQSENVAMICDIEKPNECEVLKSGSSDEECRL